MNGGSGNILLLSTNNQSRIVNINHRAKTSKHNTF